jgi:chemotaxis signal transduction protein
MSSEHIAAIAGAKDETQLVTFMLKDEEFGFDIMSVQEIIRPPKLSKVPRTPAYVDGIANLRGVVLPIIDMRPRFGMDHAEDTDSTRVLVIDVDGVKIGLRVDRVKQVTSLSKSDIEEPPAAIHGTSTDYLTGVVKLDSGARLIMALDAAKVCDLKLDGARSATSSSGARDSANSASQSSELDDLQQLVSFRVAKEEFAFPMDRVREILRVQAPTKVPDVPDYVLGVLTVRGKLLPIVDLRRQLRLESMADEYIAKCAKVRRGYEDRVAALKAKGEDSKNEWTTSISEVFHGWVLEFSSSSQVLMDGIATLRALDEKMMRSALQGQQFEHSGDSAGARACLQDMAAHAAELASALAEFEQQIAANIQDDQRIVVVDAGGMLLGLVVDQVSEVLQVSKKFVDPPPAIASGDGHDLSGIARLDEGKRLLLLLDPTQILKEANLERLTNSDHENTAEENTVLQNARSEVNVTASDEVQLVTFILGNEEFGIPIAQIQEIDRLSKITKIPKTANFVEGVTNLRGEVVSVVNTRKRFDLELRAADDHTRIIIVDLNGVKTGLIVDSVREVLTLSRADISVPPDTAQSDHEQQFVSGICKVDNGKRIIFLLNVEEVLPANQSVALLRSPNSQAIGAATETANPSTSTESSPNPTIETPKASNPTRSRKGVNR